MKKPRRYGLFGKPWWREVFPCCPHCGSVTTRHRKADDRFVCNRCDYTFQKHLMSTPENRPKIKELRQAQTRKEQDKREAINKMFGNRYP